jgi:histidyl-tRNA synthetase
VAFQSLPGFRDVFPTDMAVRQHIFGAWRAIAHRYGFEEYDGPPLESLELYVAKSGEEIVGQLYAFTDKGGREVAMRPEMTPTLARLIVAKGPSLRKPIKWFALPQLFRYEKPQKGRLREHWQFNMDILGEADVSADAELLAAAIDTLRYFGLGPTDFIARISDRRFITALLKCFGVQDTQMQAVFTVLDKWDRTPKDVSLQKLQDAGLEQALVSELLDVLHITDWRELRIEELAVAATLEDKAILQESYGRLRRLWEILEGYGLADYLRLDLTIVRGLAYYTGIVFELFDAKGELRAIAGGGRYDKLIETLGGDPMPALGFGMGDVVLAELLRQRGLMPEYKRTIDAYIVQDAQEVEPIVLHLIQHMREKGMRVERSLSAQRGDKQLKAALTSGASTIYIVGPAVLAGDAEIVERDMIAGTKQSIRLASLIGDSEANLAIERCRAKPS